MYICICHAVTDKEIRAAVNQGGASSLSDIAFQFGVGTNCGCCREAAQQLIDECTGCTKAGQCKAALAA